MQAIKHRGVMKRLESIPKEERCLACAGFGFTYRSDKAATAILEVPCGRCNRTGRAAGLTAKLTQR